MTVLCLRRVSTSDRDTRIGDRLLGVIIHDSDVA